MKITVVVTVKNEANKIRTLLDSLNIQSDKCNELIIVDGGSIDQTVKKINLWIEENKVNWIRIITKPNLNRSKARNFGISLASNEYIAVTDAGCSPHKNWIEEIKKTFIKKNDVVAGYYHMKYKNDLGKVFSRYLGIIPHRFNKDIFLPSSRSIAFTKKAWEIVGKYPEYLDTCEDLVFSQKLKNNCLMEVNVDALVDWEIPSDWKWFANKIAGYAEGDVRARYQPHLVKIGSVFGRYFLFAYIPWLFVLYLFIVWYKWRSEKMRLSNVIMAQIVSDVMVIFGALKGMVWVVRTMTL